jgi:hypothetical protein
LFSFWNECMYCDSHSFCRPSWLCSESWAKEGDVSWQASTREAAFVASGVFLFFFLIAEGMRVAGEGDWSIDRWALLSCCL